MRPRSRGVLSQGRAWICCSLVAKPRRPCAASDMECVRSSARRQRRRSRRPDRRTSSIARRPALSPCRPTVRPCGAPPALPGWTRCSVPRTARLLRSGSISPPARGHARGQRRDLLQPRAPGVGGCSVRPSAPWRGATSGCWWTSTIMASGPRGAWTVRCSRGSGALPGPGPGANWRWWDCSCCCIRRAVRAGAPRDRAPPPLAAGARARARHGAGCGGRARDRGPADGAGAAAAARTRPGRRRRRPGPRTGSIPRAWLTATAPRLRTRGARRRRSLLGPWGGRYRPRTCGKPRNTWRPYGAN